MYGNFCYRVSDAAYVREKAQDIINVHSFVS